jgi:ABC-type cobalamin/Fe3+-siderophores transport system ATPase subunit
LRNNSDFNNIAVKIERAVVSYREHVALRDVSLEIKKGEFLGIIGPNGAGKTTLLSLINGLGKLVQGNVWVLGHSISRGSVNGIRKRVGYVAQLQNIDPRMPISVEEVVMVGRYGQLGLLRRPHKADRTIVDKMLELVGMSHLAKRPIGHLSGGEQQRVAIARALAQEPEMLLLDEPTASLDWRAQGELLELIRKIHETQNLTTMFVTHDLNALPETCDRLVLMKEGKIWQQGQPEQVLKQDILSQLYDARITIKEHEGRQVFLKAG